MNEKDGMNITLDGKPLGILAAHVASITVKDSIDMMDSATFEFHLPEGSWQALKPDLNLYAKSWAIELVADGQPGKSYGGDIIDIRWTRSGGSPRSVTLTGADFLQRLQRGRSDAKANDNRFIGKTVSEMVQAIATRWKMDGGQIDSTGASLNKAVQWKDKNDAVFLKELAASCNFVVTTDFDSNSGKGKLVFVKPATLGATDVTLEFGVDILSLEATHTLKDLVPSVTVTGKNQSKDSAPVSITATTSAKPDFSPDNPGGIIGAEVVSEFGSFAIADELKEGESTDTEAVKQKARALLNGPADKFCTGTATCVYLPKVTTECKLVIKGAGWPLDGRYVIREVSHSFDGQGYHTKISFSANSIPAP